MPIDRVTFVKDVDEVRRIRNDVMHFDPEGIDDDDVAKRILRSFRSATLVWFGPQPKNTNFDSKTLRWVRRNLPWMC